MRKFIRFILIFFIILFCVISALIICGSIILYRYSDSSVNDEIIVAAKSFEKTRFYSFDNNKTKITKEITNAFLDNGIKCEYTKFDELPNDLINAFIAIEDKRFFSHHGFDYRRSSFAVANYVIKQNNSFGGSTITQQLVKNITGKDEKMIGRKLAEVFSAMDIEARYDKSEILEMYLNIINLAHGCRGVGAAAQYYFSKSVGELSLVECAAIASITNNPSRFDPQKHPDENKKRRLLVLKSMLDQGYISQDDFNSAILEDININISLNETQKINSWYIDAVTNEVIEDYAMKFGISKSKASLLLYRGGYKIYTAMDEEIQNILDDYFEDLNNFPIDCRGERPISSMIIIDPISGDILGIAGNIGEKNANRLQNYATDTQRPPGSTLKPISIYAPAYEMGFINWSSIVEDSPIIFNKTTGSPWPSNANKTYHGNVTIKYAVAHSLNTVAVKLLHRLGNDNSYTFLKDKLNITSLDAQLDIGDASLALGQPSKGMTLRELTNAYSIFQDGIYKPSRTYYKVTDSNGKIILSNETSNERAISKETSSIMTKLLQTVISEGTARGYITLPNDIEIAGKTGTTQNSQDKYFIGYTPSLLAGVWQGYEYPKPIDCFNGNYSICIWNDIMNKIYTQTKYLNEKNKFDISKNVQEYSYNRMTGLPPSEFDNMQDIDNGWFNIKTEFP